MPEGSVPTLDAACREVCSHEQVGTVGRAELGLRDQPAVGCCAAPSCRSLVGQDSPECVRRRGRGDRRQRVREHGGRRGDLSQPPSQPSPGISHFALVPLF